jgi:hypothetical protein
MKICTKCNENEVLTKAPYCRPCNREYQRQYRKDKPGYRGTGKIKRTPDRELAHHIAKCRATCRQNDKRHPDREFTLTTPYLYSLFKEQDGLCAISGLPMNHETHSPWKLSIDKIEPALGYVPGNVQWTCWAVNRARGDLCDDDLITMCKAILGKCNDYPERE